MYKFPEMWKCRRDTQPIASVWDIKVYRVHDDGLCLIGYILSQPPVDGGPEEEIFVGPESTFLLGRLLSAEYERVGGRRT